MVMQVVLGTNIKKKCFLPDDEFSRVIIERDMAIIKDIELDLKTGDLHLNNIQECS